MANTFLFTIPHWIMAGFWGMVAGSALLVGAFAGYYIPMQQKMIGAIMAFGSGILMSTIAFELMDKARIQGGFFAVATGFLVGSFVYTAANNWLTRYGARNRKRSGDQQLAEVATDQRGLLLAVGALLDGVPESIAIGIGMIKGGTVGMVEVIAIFISNIPEGLSSSAGMKKAGRSKSFIFFIWVIIALLSGLSSWAGYAVFFHFSDAVNATITAFAAGAILSMLSITMMPEAFEDTQSYTGVVTVLGFLTAFILSKSI
jgi:ZIP family zinc transporter